MSALGLDGRVAVVTGAGGGLGRAYALLLAERGARVVVNDLPGPTPGASTAEAVAEEILAAGGAAVASHDDITTPAGSRALVGGALSVFGRLDALVCNAGILRDRTLAKMAAEDFEAVLRVHLLGSALPAQAALGAMAERGFGRIVLTTSAAGLYGNFGQTNYAAAKLGVVGLLHALKLEAARHGIAVNAVSPWAATAMGRGVYAPATAERLDPALVAPLVAWLCSPACPSTGEVIVAGAGAFRRVRVVEAPGTVIPAPVTPEGVGERWEEILALEGARPFDQARDALADLLASATRPA
jgi:NAD(P)-dependent dehydrogenase (short-subunit alcohol dehydrogenase family)